MPLDPPPITIRDPGRPDQPLDLLQSGTPEREPRLTPEARRRLLRGGLGLLVALAVVATGVEVQQRRAVAAEERRLGSVVDLALAEEGGYPSGASLDTTTGRAEIEVVLQLRNDGPRPVHLASAALGDYALPVGRPLPAGQTTQLHLVDHVECTDRPPPARPPLTAVELSVRTETGQLRTVRLPFPEGEDLGAARACGFPPLHEAVFLAERSAVLGTRGLELVLEVGVQSRRRAELVTLRTDPSVRVELRHTDGAPVALPWSLPTSDPGSYVSTQLLAEVTVEDCVRARAAADEGVALLLAELTDETGATTEMSVGYDLPSFARLVDASCG